MTLKYKHTNSLMKLLKFYNTRLSYFTYILSRDSLTALYNFKSAKGHLTMTAEKTHKAMWNNSIYTV